MNSWNSIYSPSSAAIVCASIWTLNRMRCGIISDPRLPICCFTMGVNEACSCMTRTAPSSALPPFQSLREPCLEPYQRALLTFFHGAYLFPISALQPKLARSFRIRARGSTYKFNVLATKPYCRRFSRFEAVSQAFELPGITHLSQRTLKSKLHCRRFRFRIDLLSPGFLRPN